MASLFQLWTLQRPGVQKMCESGVYKRDVCKSVVDAMKVLVI